MTRVKTDGIPVKVTDPDGFVLAEGPLVEAYEDDSGNISVLVNNTVWPLDGHRVEVQE